MGYHVPMMVPQIMALGLMAFGMYANTRIAYYASEEEIEVVRTAVSNSDRQVFLCMVICMVGGLESGGPSRIEHCALIRRLYSDGQVFVSMVICIVSGLESGASGHSGRCAFI